MAKATKYQATLSTGEVLTRSSNRDYQGAWAVFFNGKIYDQGFSKTIELAQKGAKSCFNWKLSLFEKCEKDEAKSLMRIEVVQAIAI
jgi:hypothetical protein